MVVCTGEELCLDPYSSFPYMKSTFNVHEPLITHYSSYNAT